MGREGKTARGRRRLLRYVTHVHKRSCSPKSYQFSSFPLRCLWVKMPSLISWRLERMEVEDAVSGMGSRAVLGVAPLA